MPESLVRWLAPGGGGDASASLVLAGSVASYAVLVVPLHLALVWAGGDRMMRFITFTALLALGIGLAAGQGIGLVHPAMLSPAGLLPGPGALFPSGHGLAFFTYAAVLALFGKGRVALAFAALGGLVAGLRVHLGFDVALDGVAAAGLGFVAAIVAASVTMRVGIRVLGGLERTAGRVGGLLGRRLVRS